METKLPVNNVLGGQKITSELCSRNLFSNEQKQVIITVQSITIVQ